MICISFKFCLTQFQYNIEQIGHVTGELTILIHSLNRVLPVDMIPQLRKRARHARN